MIVVQQLSKSFKAPKKKQPADAIPDSGVVQAVDQVQFQCQPGRIFTLLGPNGAGKTTTLRMIATILKPSSGSIHVAGYDTVHQGAEVRRRLGFLTGGTGLYERLTGDELMDYFGKLYGLDNNRIQQRKDELFSLLQIHDYANRRIGKLSTGMKQKLNIARTMIHDPEVVVFDEPTSGLDVIAAKSIIDLIRNCKLQQKTVIFSTHIMSEVNMLSDDLAIIHKGKLIYNNSYQQFKEGMQAATLEDEFIRLATSSESVTV